MKELLSEVPTAYLSTTKEETFISDLQLMGELNSILDVERGADNLEFNEKFLRDRGIVAWGWTYAWFSGYSDTGMVGFTNNSLLRVEDLIFSVNSIKGSLQNEPIVGQKVLLSATNYRGEEMI